MNFSFISLQSFPPALGSVFHPYSEPQLLNPFSTDRENPLSEDIVNIQHTAGNNHPHCRESEAFKIQNGGAGPPFPPFRLLDCKSHVIVFVEDPVKKLKFYICLSGRNTTGLQSLNFLKKMFQQNSRQKIFQVERYIRWKYFRWKIFQVKNNWHPIPGPICLPFCGSAPFMLLKVCFKQHDTKSLVQLTFIQYICLRYDSKMIE